MKPRIAALATLAAAPIAAAQSWDFELSNPVLSPAAPSTTVTLFADVIPAEWFAGADLAVHASEAGWSDLTLRIVPPAGPLPPLQNPGEITGASVLGIHVGQSGSPLHFSGHPGRIPVWEATFTITDFRAARAIELTTQTDSFSVYTEIDPLPVREVRIATEGESSIRVIPAPAGPALLALGGLAAASRRRRTQEKTR